MSKAQITIGKIKVLAKAVSQLTVSTVKYLVYGPIIPSWGWRMQVFRDLLASFMQVDLDPEDENFKTKLDKSIKKIQKSTSYEPLYHISNDLIAERCTFNVNKAAVEYMNSVCDYNNEDAKDLNGIVRAEWIKLEHDPKNGTIIYYIHGGGYLFGSPQMDRLFSYFLAKQGYGKTFATSYRLAPRYKFPCAVIDALSGYMYLLEQGYEAERIVLAGESAGGGLVLAITIAIRNMKLPKPSAVVCFSPWTDLTASQPSFEANGVYDFLPDVFVKDLYAPLEYLKNPFVSPLFAQDLTNFPPILIQVGSCERLYDEDCQMAVKIGQQNPNVRVELEIYQDQIHVFPLFGFSKASKAAFQRVGKFINMVRSEHYNSGFFISVISADGRSNEPLHIKSKL